MSSESRQALNAVLCIGSDPVPLNLRCAALRQDGWRVSSSGSGHEGLLRFGEERVDIVILDFNDDGSEAALIAGQLKKQRPDVRVIILVSPGKPLLHAALGSADAVVPKSGETTELIKALRAVQRPAKA
jgi:DNA-binding response OmpR family regulator